MSVTSRPARARALRAAGAGPVSMMVGSLPTTAALTILARGVSPRSAAARSLPISIAAAPSTIWEELPAVCTCRMRSTVGYRSIATASNPAAPIAAKLGSSAASPSRVVSGRIASSWSSTTTPFWSITGTSDLAKYPLSRACVARCWERSAYRSTSSRVNPSSVATRSALTPCGTNPMARLVSGSIAQAPPSDPIGTRDIDSTPPATTRSSYPERTLHAARLTASRPDAQNRFTCTPAARRSQPAASTAVRAMSPPCSPTGVTQPSTTSSTRAVSRFVRSRSARSTPAASVTGLTLCSAPRLPLPRGVRTASKMNASVMSFSTSPASWPHGKEAAAALP